MSTQETAKLTVELILSNQEGAGELPDDNRITGFLTSLLSNRVIIAGQAIDVLLVNVVGRTGELDASQEEVVVMDLMDSLALAMTSKGFSQSTADDIVNTVKDYYGNHYG